MSSTDSNRHEDSEDNELVILPSETQIDEEAQTEGAPKSSIWASAQQQSDGNEKDSPNGMNSDESARLWEYLKAETGYASYTAHLDAYKGRIP